MANLFTVLKERATPGPYLSLTAAGEAGAVTLNYGVFINTIISFILVALAVFLIIRAVNRLKKKEKAKPSKKECPYCFRKIDIKAIRCPNCTSELEVR